MPIFTYVIHAFIPRLGFQEGGKVYGWGSGGYGALSAGDQAKNDQWYPKEIDGLEDIIQAAVGTTHALAVTSNTSTFEAGNICRGCVHNCPEF